jgi:hypothetical protein
MLPRVVTDWLDHVGPAPPGKSITKEIARAAWLFEGPDDGVKSRLHSELCSSPAANQCPGRRTCAER